MRNYLKQDYGKILVLLISIIITISIPRLKIEQCEASLESEKSTFLTLINQYRQRNGLPPLSLSNTLTTAAQLHSEDMASRNYFSHTTPEGKTFVDRIREAGYTYATCLGENIAAGFSTAQEVFEAWKNSPGHNQNMLDPCFKAIGIGLAYSASSTYKWYWTTDFGGYDDSGSGGGGGSTPSLNNPPNRPEKPSGPGFGHIDEEYAFITVSKDPDGDPVMYIFDWGDGTTSTTSYFPSGTPVSLSHSWSNPGSYSIKVMAKDKRGASSSWSSPTMIQIIIPKLEVTLASNILGIEISVDGVKYSAPSTFRWFKKTVHNVSVLEIVEFTEGGRYFFKGWSDGVKNRTRTITVKENTSIIAIYEVQYLFTYRTHPDNFISNWYPNGTVLNLSVEPFIHLNYGERLVFRKWPNNATDLTINIIVDKPGFIEALWCRQFLVKLYSPYGMAHGEGWYDEGSIVKIWIDPHVVELENGIRMVFEAWIGEGHGSYSGFDLSPAIIAKGQINETALWRTEYLLTIETEYGNPSGAGWYNISSIAEIFIEPVVYDSPVIRHVFQGWEGGFEENSNNVTLRVDTPIVLKAVWNTEYYLNVSSEYGEVWGSGWYLNNSYVSFGVKPPSFHIVPYVFEGWGEDAYSRSLNATIIMDGPKKVVAKWRRDYTWLTLVLIILIVTTVFAYHRKRGRQIIRVSPA
ncbi:MAG: PKD domain-containing protein [Candidatus Brockarchaeota archaeon]|nr:PKD domain-containing protein [Candidatus Brockarchaeota archaeon]